MATTQEKATHADRPICDVVGAKGAVQEWVPVADERRAAAPQVEAVGKLIAPAEDVPAPPVKPSSKGDDLLDLPCSSSVVLSRYPCFLRVWIILHKGLTGDEEDRFKKPRSLSEIGSMTKKDVTRIGALIDKGPRRETYKGTMG